MFHDFVWPGYRDEEPEELEGQNDSSKNALGLAAGLAGELVPEPAPEPASKVTGPTTSFGCFHCDAKDWRGCYASGRYQKCQSNQVCMTEIRQRDGELFNICMRCKERTACQNQRKNNFQGRNGQCRPSPKWKPIAGPSVCRQCCDTDRCTNNYNPGKELLTLFPRSDFEFSLTPGRFHVTVGNNPRDTFTFMR